MNKANHVSASPCICGNQASFPCVKASARKQHRAFTERLFQGGVVWVSRKPVHEFDAAPRHLQHTSPVPVHSSNISCGSAAAVNDCVDPSLELPVLTFLLPALGLPTQLARSLATPPPPVRCLSCGAKAAQNSMHPAATDAEKDNLSKRPRHDTAEHAHAPPCYPPSPPQRPTLTILLHCSASHERIKKK